MIGLGHFPTDASLLPKWDVPLPPLHDGMAKHAARWAVPFPPLHDGRPRRAPGGAPSISSSMGRHQERRRRVLLHGCCPRTRSSIWIQEREVIFHGFQEIKKAFLDFKVSSPFVRARSLDHGGKVSQDHEIKKGFLDCQKERRVLLIWGFLDWFLNCSRKGSRNQEKVLLCMNLDL